MDNAVVQALQEAGLDPTGDEDSLWVPIVADEDGHVVEPGEEIPVFDREHLAMVPLKSISELWAGDRQPPDFGGAPPAAYLPFFLAIERAAADFCFAEREFIRDKEFSKIYNDLRRLPDGRGRHPVFRHLQATLRLLMSLRDVSRAEYEAVLTRLSRSARTFAMGHESLNYTEHALRPLSETGRGIMARHSEAR